MFGKDRGSFGPPSSNDEVFSHIDNLLSLADNAHAKGQLAQAAHLYVAAYDASVYEGASAYSPAIEGLRKAWDAAYQLKERALAEHIFEKLEAHLSSEDIALFTEQLQRLALDKLEEFGFSREDLQDMADMVSEDFLGTLRESQQPEGVYAQVVSVDNKAISPVKGVLSWPKQPAVEHQASEEEEANQAGPRNPEDYTYSNLVGFDRVIAHMNKKGIGLSGDVQFTSFMAALAKRHGISSVPFFETMLFRSPSREDANQFMFATMQELHLPCVRMYMEETPMGFPLLCVVATSNFKMNPVRGGFEGPGIVLLEDIDLWGEPFTAEMEEDDSFSPYAYLSRGAREAVMFIRAAVENPEVQVMATVSSLVPLDDFFVDLLSPLSFVDVDLPNEAERSAVWKDVFSLYPSLRLLANSELVRLSANLSRADIYLAAREAVDQAFKASVEQRRFIPVTQDNLYNKIAAFQPLDSSEYLELEESAIESLRLDLENEEDLLKGLD